MVLPLSIQIRSATSNRSGASQSTTSAPSSIIAFFLASGAVRGITITALAPFILAP